MQLSTLLTLTLTALGAVALPSANANPEPNTTPTFGSVLARRGCYSGGEPWGGEANKARDSVKLACAGPLGNRIYDNRETRSACYNLNGGKRAEFQIRHLHNVGRFISSSECEDGLLKEINGCGNGGESEYTNWWYRYVFSI